MQIALVTTSYPLMPGQAAGHFVAEEAHALCAQGHRVSVIAPGPQRSESGHNPRVLRVPAGKLFGPPGALPRLRQNPLRLLHALAFVRRARRLLAELGPFDRVVAHWLLPCAWPIALGRAPVLEAVAHGSDVRLLCKLPRWLGRYIVRELMRPGSELRFVSQAQRTALQNATGVTALAHSRVVPSALALPDRPSRPRARQRLGIAVEARLVVIVARLVAGKRVETALRAVSLLPGVSVVVIGGGPLLSELARRFPWVCFTGQLLHGAALEWIAAADLLLSASRDEGAPTAVREARALGVPVVAVEAGDLSGWAESDPGLWILPAR